MPDWGLVIMICAGVTGIGWIALRLFMLGGVFRKLLLSLAIWVVVSLVWQYALTPVMEWCEWEWSDNGSTVTIYHYSAPSHWEKWTNSDEWQKWKGENWGSD